MEIKLKHPSLQTLKVHFLYFRIQRNLEFSIYAENMKAALKVVSPILQCGPTTSETNGGGITVEAEPSEKYPIPLCCCVIDGSRGAV